MGRGVGYLNNAAEVTFFDISSMGMEAVFGDDGEVIEDNETYDSV